MAIVISGGAAKRVNSSQWATMREAYDLMRREIEDLGYINLSAPDERESGLEDDPSRRAERLRHIRILRRRNPLAKNAANLLQHYVLGQGITLRANNKQLVARIIDEFRNDPVNKVTFTGHQASKEALDTVFTDGEFYLVLYPDSEAGTVELGHIDTMNVADVITDRKNRKIAKWYKVKNVERAYNYDEDRPETAPEDEWVYYRDWRNDSDEDAPPASKRMDGLVYHIAINKRGRRGESELAAAVDWIRAHKNFMEDRATINRAAASIAWKKKRKGGAPNDIAAELERLRSGIASGAGYENNPPPTAGSTAIENENSTLEWVKTDVGGQAALADERILRMMSGSAMGGIPNHYFGDEANANLATATAMELPLLKTYEDWQAFWADVWRDIIEFLLNTAHEAGRIGERDDSNRYTDRVTTPQDTIQADDELGTATPVGEAEPMTGNLTMIPRPQPTNGTAPAVSMPVPLGNRGRGSRGARHHQAGGLVRRRRLPAHRAEGPRPVGAGHEGVVRDPSRLQHRVPEVGDRDVPDGPRRQRRRSGHGASLPAGHGGGACRGAGGAGPGQDAGPVGGDGAGAQPGRAGEPQRTAAAGQPARVG